MSRPVVSTALAVILALLSACGGDDDSDEASVAPSEADVTVVAEDALDFDEDEYTASAGEIAFAYDNGGSILHTLVVEGREDDLRLEVRSAGDVDAGSIELDAGEYVLYCDVTGHQSGGMEATLTVE